MIDMLLNCIIFAVIVWRVLSALGLMGGNANNQIPKNMTQQKRPVPQQARPQAQPRTVPQDRDSSAWNFDAYQQKTDEWEEFRTKNGPNFKPGQDKQAAERERLQKIKEKLDRQKREAAVKKAKSESKKAESSPQPQTMLGFTHISDHSAEVHLEQSFDLHAKADALISAKTSQPSPHADLVRLLKDPKQARNAFVLSMILGEPKALSNQGRGMR